MKGWKTYLLPGIAALLLLLYYLLLAPSLRDDAVEATPKTELPGASAPPRRPVSDPSER